MPVDVVSLSQALSQAVTPFGEQLFVPLKKSWILSGSRSRGEAGGLLSVWLAVEGTSALFLITACYRGPRVHVFPLLSVWEWKCAWRQNYDHIFLNFITQTLNDHLVLGRGGLYFQYFLFLQTALGLLPTGNVCHPSKNSCFFSLSHQGVLCDLQHISKHACESVVNRTRRHSSLRKSMCRIQSRMIIFQKVFPVELKNSGSQKQIFLLATIIWTAILFPYKL